MVTTAENYEQMALNDPEGRWELHKGRPRQKPTMTTHHNHAQYRLSLQLARQLDEEVFHYRLDNSRAACLPGSYYIPDLFVVPTEFVRGRLESAPRLEVFTELLPLVVEVWSPSAGNYDVDSKLPVYRQRGDLEIWRIHSLERTLAAWRRQPDGTYSETFYTGGTIEPVALPGVVIDIDRLVAP